MSYHTKLQSAHGDMRCKSQLPSRLTIKSQSIDLAFMPSWSDPVSARHADVGLCIHTGYTGCARRSAELGRCSQRRVMSETQHASAQQGSVASTTANGQQVPDVAQWAAMQAFYKNSGAPQAPFLPPGFPPGSGAYATQFWGAGGPAVRHSSPSERRRTKYSVSSSTVCVALLLGISTVKKEELPQLRLSVERKAWTAVFQQSEAEAFGAESLLSQKQK